MRLRWVVGAVATIAVLAAGSLVGIQLWAQHYSPLDTLGFFGPELSTDRYLGPSGGDTQYMHNTLDHRTSWLSGLRNFGGTPIVIDSVAPVAASGVVAWSPYVVVPGGDISGQPEAPRPWPAHLKGRTSIRLRITLNAERCRGQQPVVFDALRVRWHLYGVHHSQDFRTNESVQLCPATTSTKEWVTSPPRDAIPLP